MNKQRANILHVSDKLDYRKRLLPAIWPVFSSFFVFFCYFIRLKPREMSRQNMRKLETKVHIVLGTMR